MKRILDNFRKKERTKKEITKKIYYKKTKTITKITLLNTV